jgi:hypothetical protein
MSAILRETALECRQNLRNRKKGMAPKRGTGVITPPPLVTLNIMKEKSDNGLYAEDQTLDKHRHMTINTRPSMTIARLDINAGRPKKLPTWSNALQVVSERPSLFEGVIG